MEAEKGPGTMVDILVLFNIENVDFAVIGKEDNAPEIRVAHAGTIW